MNLLTAIKQGTIENVKKLLENGANPNEGNEIQFRFPICWAVRNKNISKVKLLLEYGADINNVTITNRTPLMLCVVYNQDKVFKLILEKEPDLSITSKHGRNIFFLASVNENSFYTKELLKGNPSLELVDQQDFSGVTPLLNALDKKKIDNAIELIRYGADMNITRHNGKHIVDYVIEYKKVELFEAIEDRKDDLDERGKALFERTKLKFQLL